MKKNLFIILTLSLISCGKEDDKNIENPCPQLQIEVEINQKITLVDNEGNFVDNIDYNNLELLPTDANFVTLYDNFQQVPNSFEATFVNENNSKYIQLYLGQTDKMKQISKDTCYFILKVNENNYHRITAIYNIECNNFILKKFLYNDVMYDADDTNIVNVTVQ